MFGFSLGFALALSTAAFAAPAIQAIDPAVFATQGGNRYARVVLTGIDLGICGTNCPGVSVLAGGEAVPFFGNGSKLLITVPDDMPPGVANLEVHTAQGNAAVEDAMLFVAPSEFETILLPHAGGGEDVPGANGSVWRAESFIRNDSAWSLRFDLPLFPQTLISPSFVEFLTVAPHATVNLELANAHAPVRVMVPKALASQVTFETRLYDASRDDQTFGTRVPTVRETDFRHGVTTIPGVPMGSRFRANVRVFSVDGQRHAYHVRVLTQPDVFVPPFEGYTTPLPVETLAELPVTTELDPLWEGSVWDVAFATLALPVVPASTPKLQVQIEPLDGDAPFWAYVSVTNNDTQQVTLLTP